MLGLDTLRDNNTLMLLLVLQHNTTSLVPLLLLITNPLLAYKSQLLGKACAMYKLTDS